MHHRPVQAKIISRFFTLQQKGRLISKSIFSFISHHMHHYSILWRRLEYLVPFSKYMQQFTANLLLFRQKLWWYMRINIMILGIFWKRDIYIYGTDSLLTLWNLCSPSDQVQYICNSKHKLNQSQLVNTAIPDEPG